MLDRLAGFVTDPPVKVALPDYGRHPASLDMCTTAGRMPTRLLGGPLRFPVGVLAGRGRSFSVEDVHRAIPPALPRRRSRQIVMAGRF